MSADDHMAKLERLAAEDPYWRGYLAGLKRLHERDKPPGRHERRPDAP